MKETETGEVFDGDKLNICFLELERFDNYLDKNSDLKEQWCWIFNNLAKFAKRPENLDSSFDPIIKDADTHKLSISEKLKYMEALHLNERERQVVYEGGYIIGHTEGKAEGKAEGLAEAARAMLAKGIDVETIAECTGLSPEQIKAFK